MKITRSSVETMKGPAEWFSATWGDHVADEEYNAASQLTDA